MKLNNNEQRFFKLVKRAGEIELICLVAITMTSQAGDKCSPIPATKGAYKRAIKRLRETQTKRPEYSDTYEDAICLIRQEWLQK